MLWNTPGEPTNYGMGMNLLLQSLLVLLESNNLFIIDNNKHPCTRQYNTGNHSTLNSTYSKERTRKFKRKIELLHFNEHLIAKTKEATKYFLHNFCFPILNNQY